MSGTGGFQTQVTDQPAPAVAGDFASTNPYFTYDAGPGGLVAGAPNGVVIGRFAWVFPPVDPNGTGKIVQNSGAGAVAGFVHRAQQGLIVNYLQFAGMVIQPGFQMGLMTGGDFWVVNDGATEALVGQKAYANFADGKVSFAASGSPPGGASATGSSIDPETFSVTGSIDDDVLTVTAVGSGTIVNGATISGTGIASGTKIVSQLSGTAGGVGTYTVSIPEQSVDSTTVSGTYGLFTVGTATGTFGVGDVLSGSGGGGVTAGTVITQLLSGAGGSGSTFAVDPTQTVTSSTIAATTSVETKWYARSSGLAGELVKISDHPTG